MIRRNTKMPVEAYLSKYKLVANVVQDSEIKPSRVAVINGLIRRNAYKSYLEIGVQAGKSYSNVECLDKTGFDPAPTPAAKMLKGVQSVTSDDGFAQTDRKWDIIFIDGLHHSEQVVKDLNNALARLNPGGAIVMHDCIPQNEPMQRVPRETKQWTGDVWRVWVAAVQQLRPTEYDVYCYDFDFGVGVIRHLA